MPERVNVVAVYSSHNLARQIKFATEARTCHARHIILDEILEKSKCA